MRASVFGLFFAVLAALLMCRALTVPGTPAEAEPAGTWRPGQAVMLPAKPLGGEVPLAADRERAPEKARPTAALPIRAAAVPRAVDANGLPVLSAVYYRSNYRAFCLTDSGG